MGRDARCDGILLSLAEEMMINGGNLLPFTAEASRLYRHSPMVEV